MMKQRLAALIGIMSFCLLCRADEVESNARITLKNGRNIFRFDTFGDQAFWGDTLKLHQSLEGADHGGIGPGVSPSTALAVGLKVDVDALPQSLKKNLAAGEVDLNDPANTLALLKLNAVVGVTGFFDPQQRLSSLGIQCALCHSTVDNSFAPGIGRRLDGWPNRDLNVGAIINLSPDLSAFSNALQVDEATVRTVLLSWGPGKFDAALLLDGKAFRPDGKSAATLIPAAFGLAGINLHTYTGWGSVPYWNAFVANLEMQGSGRFYDPRLNDTNTFPVPARLGFANVQGTTEDRKSTRLNSSHGYISYAVFCLKKKKTTETVSSASLSPREQIYTLPEDAPTPVHHIDFSPDTALRL